MQNQRLNYIDRLKGFAIFMVVFGHVIVYGLQNYDDTLRMFASSFHMPLFMFLSGLVISSVPTPRKFLVKACRFLCPLLTIGLLYNAYLGKLSHKRATLMTSSMGSSPRNSYTNFFHHTTSTTAHGKST